MTFDPFSGPCLRGCRRSFLVGTGVDSRSEDRRFWLCVKTTKFGVSNTFKQYYRDPLITLHNLPLFTIPLSLSLSLSPFTFHPATRLFRSDSTPLIGTSTNPLCYFTCHVLGVPSLDGLSKFFSVPPTRLTHPNSSPSHRPLLKSLSCTPSLIPRHTTRRG